MPGGPPRPPYRVGEDASVYRRLPGARWEPADTALADAP